MEQRIITQQEYSNYRYIRERCEVKRHTYNFKHATYDEVMRFLFHNSEVTSAKRMLTLHMSLQIGMMEGTEHKIVIQRGCPFTRVNYFVEKDIGLQLHYILKLLSCIEFMHECNITFGQFTFEYLCFDENWSVAPPSTILQSPPIQGSLLCATGESANRQ